MEKNSEPEKKINQKRKTKNSSEPSLDNTSWWDNPDKILPSYADNSFEPPLDHDSKMLVFFWLTNKPQEFITYVKANPDSVFLNPYIQMAIKLLRGWCLHARSEGAKEGRRLLKAVGLPGLIPKNLPKRKTNSYFLNSLKDNPIMFSKQVEKYKQIIGQFVHFPYGRNVRNLENDTGKAFKHIYRKPIRKELLIEARIHDLTSIAISFIAFEDDELLRDKPDSNPFYSLRKFYRNLPHFD